MVNVDGIESGKNYFTSEIETICIHGVQGDKLHVSITDLGVFLLEEDYYAVDGCVTLYEVGRLLQSRFQLKDPSEVIRLDNRWHGSQRLSLEFKFTDEQGTVSISCYAFFCRASSSVSPSDTLFLTHEHTIRTAPNRLEFLTMMTLTGVTVDVSIVYLDVEGEEHNRLVNYGLLSENWLDCYLFSLPYIASLAGLSTTSILYYDALLKLNGTLKDKVRFINDTRQYRHLTKFIYQNAFGLPETITFTGLAEYAPELEGELVDLLQKTFHTDVRYIDARTINSGYLNSFQYAKALDLLTSESICLYDAGKAEKVVITDIDFNHKPVGNEKINVSLTVQKATRNHLAFERIANIRKIFDYTFDRTFE